MRFLSIAILIFFSCLQCPGQVDCELASGLAASLAVKPGLVRHPMMASLDDQGRLFVAESSGENFSKDELLKMEKKPHSIRMLTDTDGDGVFDQATVFADNMMFPQGALWVEDTLYVMSPPGLWSLEDKNNDGVAEKRTLMVEGFEFDGNAADVHGPFLHPNGRLYWCHGRKGHEVREPVTGDLVSKAKGARIWSCDINGRDVRVHAGGGFDNPVEVDFTETGEIIGTVNIFHGRPRGDVLAHWLYGGVYPRDDQEKVLEEFRRTGPLLPELHNFGHVAVSGMCRYRTGALFPEWKDQYLVAHFNASEITRTRVEKQDAGFRAAGTERIFHLKKPHAHLTDVLEDHNGDLLVIDTGGWFRRGCPTSQVARPEVEGGIYRISRPDRPSPKAVHHSPQQWKSMEASDVALLLDDPSPFIRDRAVTELAVRGDPAIAEAELILKEGQSRSVTQKINAIWTLSRLSFSDSPDLITLALNDSDPNVKMAACNAIAVTRDWQRIARNQPMEMVYEIERNKSISGILASLVRSDRPDVARCAATALGAMADSRSLGSLFGRVGREETASDRPLQHAITYALIEIGDLDRLLDMLRIGNPRQQNAALWALESLENYRLESIDIVLFLDSDDAALRESVAEIARRHPEWDAAVANQFFVYTDQLTPRRRDTILRFMPVFGKSRPVIDFLDYAFQHENPEVRALAESALPRLGRMDLPEGWAPMFRDWLSGRDPAKRQLALDALGSLKTDQLNAELDAIAADPALSAILRVKAVQSKSGKNDIPPAAFDLITAILGNPASDSASRSSALEALAASRPSPAQLTALPKVFSALNPVEMARVIDLYPGIANEEMARALAAALPGAPGFGALNHAEIRGWFSGFDPSLSRPLKEAMVRIEAERRQKLDKLSQLVAELPQGNAEKGRQHFAAGKGACSSCHQVGETGRAIGPSLAGLAKIRQPVDFFESILFPSESIARDFDSYLVTTRNEGSFSGLIQRESEQTVYLTELSGSVREISRESIASIDKLPVSLMPAGLENSLSRQELLDIVSWLLSLKERRGVVE